MCSPVASSPPNRQPGPQHSHSFTPPTPTPSHSFLTLHHNLTPSLHCSSSLMILFLPHTLPLLLLRIPSSHLTTILLRILFLSHDRFPSTHSSTPPLPSFLAFLHHNLAPPSTHSSSSFLIRFFPHTPSPSLLQSSSFSFTLLLFLLLHTPLLPPSHSLISFPFPLSFSFYSRLNNSTTYTST